MRAVSDITGGIYQCCNGHTIQANGSLTSYNASDPPWNTSAFSALDMYQTLVIYQNCSAKNTDPDCWTPGDTCEQALARVDDFGEELLGMIEAYKLKGIHLDWEFGYGCNVTCHQQLWGHLSKKLRANGKELAVSVDDSKHGSAMNISATNWTYETDWYFFETYADVMIDMGTCAPSLSQAFVCSPLLCC